MAKRGAAPVAAVIALAVLLATLATARPGDPTLYPAKPDTTVAIFLLDNGFHTDLVLPRAAVLADGGPISAALRETTADPWVMVGWGDARFYEDQSAWQSRIFDGARALLGGRPTVTHLEGVYDQPDRVWRTGVRRIVVSHAGLAALLKRIDRSFRPGPGGAPVADPAPHAHDESYFQSGEDFSLLHLCNHWTAEALNAAGLPVTPVLDTVPAGLALDLWLRAGD
ncbi:MAG TPA: DUF2459 domain-containing protein [Caulobacteraceae bacterium]